MVSARSEGRQKRRPSLRRAHVRALGMGSVAGLGAAAAATAGFAEAPSPIQWIGFGLASVIAALLAWQNEKKSASPVGPAPPTINIHTGGQTHYFFATW